MMSIKGILTAIEAGGLVAKLAMGATILALAVAIYGVWHHRVYQEGFDAAIAKVAAADAKTVARALAARAVLKDCQSRNLKWDQSTGKCL